MNREYHVWHSPHLKRDQEMLVFGHAGTRVVVFPTRDGRFFDYENWRLVAALAPKIEAGHLQLFCVDSVDRYTLYADWMRPEDRMAAHLRFEEYILYEVLPFSLTRSPDAPAIAHGCSLGAFHAMNIALKHPDHFYKVVALSGRYDLTEPVVSFRGLFDGFYDETVYFNTPSHYVAGLHEGPYLDRLRTLDITFAVGEEDAFAPNNRVFSQLLSDKGIRHGFHLWEGEAHRPRAWRQMVSLYM